MARTTTTAAAAAAFAMALSACGGDSGPGPTEGNSSTPAAPSTSDGDPNSSTPSGTAAADDDPEMGEDEDSDTESEADTNTEDEDSEDDSGEEDEEKPSSTSTDTGTPFDPDEFTGKLKDSVEENPTVNIDVTATLDGEQDVTATGTQDLENDALDMEVDMAGQQLGYRLVDGQYYLSQPPKWVPVTEDSTNPLIKQTLETVQLLSMRKQFDAFVAGVEKAGDKGTEEIDGVETRHYTATVNTDKAYGELDADKDPNAPETLIYDVWLDEDDLIRQMQFTQDGAEATLVAKDWGEPVDISKPKDSEISDPG